MSKLARPGFSRLKAPTYAKSRQSGVIVTPTADGIEATQVPTDTASQQIPGSIATHQVRPTVKKSENVSGQPKVEKPAASGLPNNKKSSKLAANRNVQHGTGPYERAKPPSSTIPYVGKKRPAGVLKSPDSRASAISKPYITNGTVKHNETLMTESKITKEKSIPTPKPSENGMHAMPRALKRTSLPQGKSQGCTDLAKNDTSRRQTISTPTKSNSKLSFSKSTSGIRPRSSCATDSKKTDSKKNMSKSLQSLPKAIGTTTPPMNKPLSKKESSHKSVSHDDILNCSKKELKKPVAGVLPRSKTGFSSKFGFGRVAEKPRSSSTNSIVNTTVSTPQSHINVDTFDHHELSPIIGTPASARGHSLEETFNKVSDVPTNGETCNRSSSGVSNRSSSASINKAEGMDAAVNVSNILDTSNSIQSDDNANNTKQINIIINLDTVETSEGINTTATLSKDGSKESIFTDKDIDEACLAARPCKVNDGTFNKSSREINDRTFDKTRPTNSSTSDILNKTQIIETYDSESSSEQNQVLNKTTTFEDLSPIETSYEANNRTFNQIKSLNNSANNNMNKTQTIDTYDIEDWNEPNLDLNKTKTLDKSSEHISPMARSYETNDRTFNKSKSLDTSGSRILNRTQTIESDDIENFNRTRILPNDSLDKSDSGFDDTANFLNISDVPPGISSLSPLNDSKSICVEKRDMTMDGDLSEDVLKVIAAISSNINRTCNTATFSQSPIKQNTDLMAPHKSDFMYCLSKDLSMNTTNWLDDVGLTGPALEDTLQMSQPLSLSEELDEYNSRYETDDLISKSTVIDVSEATSSDTVGLVSPLEDKSHKSQPVSLSQELDEYNSRYETDDLISKSTTIDMSELTSTKQFNDVEDISHCTDISQSTEKYRNHLSSIGTDSDGVEDIDIVPLKDNSIGLNEYLDDCYCDTNLEENPHFSKLNAIHNSLKLKKDSIGSEVLDAVLCDSGHCTDMNDNEVNLDITNKLTINDVRTDLFTTDAFIDGSDKIFTDGSEKTCPSTPPHEFASSVSSDTTCPSTPLSRQESLEYDVTRRCNTVATTTRRMKKVARSRTYSSSDLITKFRVPKEPKCIETNDGDILMDKTTFLHFMNEVKLVKTSLLKLKRTLVEAPCASPLVKSPIKRSVSAVEASAIPPLSPRTCQSPCASPLAKSPLKRSSSLVEASAVPPLSPRTCQCSPMAVVNPLVLRTGIISSPSKEKEIVYSSEEEKLQDFASTIKILQTQLENCEQKQQDLIEENILLRSLQENCEQKQQDIIEENILLREEISHLTERLRKTRVCESGTAEHGSVDDIVLATDLDSRLPIIQRMYSGEYV